MVLRPLAPCGLSWARMVAAVSFMGSVRPSAVVPGSPGRRLSFVRVVEHVGDEGELVGPGVVPEERFQDGAVPPE